MEAHNSNYWIDTNVNLNYKFDDISLFFFFFIQLNIDQHLIHVVSFDTTQNMVFQCTPDNSFLHVTLQANRYLYVEQK